MAARDEREWLEGGPEADWLEGRRPEDRPGLSALTEEERNWRDTAPERPQRGEDRSFGVLTEEERNWRDTAPSSPAPDLDF